MDSITLSASLKILGANAFNCCHNLKSIIIPNNVEEIKDSTFYICDSLENITLPSSLKKIGIKAFYYCDNLKSISIPNNVEEIEDSVFYGCSSLDNITLPSSLKKITTTAIPNTVKELYYNGIKVESISSLDCINYGLDYKTYQKGLFANFILKIDEEKIEKTVCFKLFENEMRYTIDKFLDIQLTTGSSNFQGTLIPKESNKYFESYETRDFYLYKHDKSLYTFSEGGYLALKNSEESSEKSIIINTEKFDSFSVKKSNKKNQVPHYIIIGKVISDEDLENLKSIKLFARYKIQLIKDGVMLHKGEGKWHVSTSSRNKDSSNFSCRKQDYSNVDTSPNPSFMDNVVSVTTKFDKALRHEIKKAERRK